MGRCSLHYLRHCRFCCHNVSFLVSKRCTRFSVFYFSNRHNDLLTWTLNRLLFLIPMIYGAILYHKDRKSIAALSSYSTPVYNVPTGSESIQYQGAPIPRPEFVDVEDGQGHGFRKTDQYGIKTRATAYDGQTQNLLGNGPQKTMYA